MKTINFLNLLVLVCGLYLVVYFRLAGLLVFTALFMLMRQLINTDDNIVVLGKGWKHLTVSVVSSLLLGGVLSANKSFSNSLSIEIAEFATKASAFDSATTLLNLDDEAIKAIGVDIGNPKRSTLEARMQVSGVHSSPVMSVDSYSYMTIVSFLSYLFFVIALSMNLYSKPSALFMGFPNKQSEDKLSTFLNSKSAAYQKRVRFFTFLFCFLPAVYVMGFFGNIVTSSEFILHMSSGKIHIALGAHFIIFYLLWDSAFTV